ncbi:MAG TPA: hypothetical protein VN794_07845, partial [Methylomirabilota bacterium]|nr:hypothetical protein [Methylomirabilota bacterium]
VFGGPIVDGSIAWARGQRFEPHLSPLSPGYVFVNAGAWGRAPYWSSLLTNQIVCWVLFVAACIVAPRSWQQRSRRGGGISTWAYTWKYGSARRRARLRRRLIDRYPIVWLACRERWQATGVWIISIAVLVGFLLLSFSKLHSSSWIAWRFVSPLFTWIIYLWAASQACRFFIEARKSGFLELLLSGPVTERRIVNGHWRGLLRMFAIPAGLLVGVHVTASVWSQLAMGATGAFGEENAALMVISAVTTTVTTLGNLLALAWFGMWMGLSSKSANWASAKTFLFVQVIPQVVFGFVGSLAAMLLLIPWMSKYGSGSTAFPIAIWYPIVGQGVNCILMLMKNVGFFLLSRKKLYESFRGYVTGTGGRHGVLPPPVPVGLAPPVATLQP